MMIKAQGPVWHKKQKDQGMIPQGLRGLDQQATWGYSKYDNWVYGHGTYSMTSHEIPVLGRFIWMRNSACEAKTLWFETSHHKGNLDYVLMDSKADDSDLFRELKKQRQMHLITLCRQGMDKTPQRKAMIAFMQQPENKKLYQQRSITVEPMQGLVKEIFSLDQCWMKGDQNNRWLFAAMGLAVQMHQLRAWKQKLSTWKIKQEVLGI